MREVQPRHNNLGWRGWFFGGKYKGERYLYILHRVTGLGMTLFVAFHLVETTVFRMQGKDIWEATVKVFKQPAFEVGIFFVSVAFAFHAINGIRLILQELGFALGKPTRPIYPYKDALRKKRGFTIIIVAVIAVISILFLYNFVGGSR